MSRKKNRSSSELEPVFDFRRDNGANSKNRTRTKIWIVVSVVAVIALSGISFFLGTHVNQASSALETKGADIKRLGGHVSLSAVQLRNLVLKYRLVAYWTGPEKSARYTLYVPNNRAAIVRYLPNGKGLNDASPSYRVIATYKQLGAFSNIKSAGEKTGNLGYTNIDGVAVSYVKSRPTNVYMAIKGKNLQLEVFDPNADQAIALSLYQGAIKQIQ